VTAQRARDFAIYTAIGLGFGLLCISFAVRNIDVKWLTLSFETSLVFGWTIAALKRLWRIPIFWISLAFFLIVHLIAFVLVLREVHQWRAPIVGLTFTIEAGAVVTSCEFFSPSLGKRRKER
jgi:hypothetical protein